MHASKRDLPREALENWVSHATEWGGMAVSIDCMAKGLDGTDAFKALPDKMCPVPHWGYVIQGQMRIRYRDHEEVIRSGQAFYLEPGHIPFADEETDVVFFSPAEQMNRLMEALG